MILETLAAIRNATATIRTIVNQFAGVHVMITGSAISNQEYYGTLTVSIPDVKFYCATGGNATTN